MSILHTQFVRREETHDRNPLGHHSTFESTETIHSAGNLIESFTKEKYYMFVDGSRNEDYGLPWFCSGPKFLQDIFV